MGGENIAYVEQVSRSLDLLDGKWTVQVIWAMRSQPVRLSELQRLFPTASKKALTASLRALQASGLIVRRDLSESVLHVEYQLASELQEPLLAALDCLANFGNIAAGDALIE